MKCPSCNRVLSLDVLNLLCSLLCPHCMATILVEQYPPPSTLQCSSKYNTGDIVKIINKEHLWFQEIAIVRESKNRFCKIELFGRTIRVPEHWLEII